MGVTNQQIADIIQESITVFDRRLGQLIEAFDQVTASDRVEHQDFRQALMELSTTTQLQQARLDHHSENWKKVWAVLAAALLPIIAAIVALVLNK